MGAENRLAACLAPILRDLAAAGVPAPEVRGEPWCLGPGMPTGVMYAADGSARGIRIPPEIPFADQVAMLADQVQHWVAASSRTAGAPALWPECPQHPDSHGDSPGDPHPLRTEVVPGSEGAAGVGIDTTTGRAVWCCPRSGRFVSVIGELPAVRTGQ